MKEQEDRSMSDDGGQSRWMTDKETLDDQMENGQMEGKQLDG